MHDYPCAAVIFNFNYKIKNKYEKRVTRALWMCDP